MKASIAALFAGVMIGLAIGGRVVSAQDVIVTADTASASLQAGTTPQVLVFDDTAKVTAMVAAQAFQTALDGRRGAAQAAAARIAAFDGSATQDDRDTLAVYLARDRFLIP